MITFQICILNFGIYIGSSIYTPGDLDIMEEFGASEIVATLGLSLFVLWVYEYLPSRLEFAPTINTDTLFSKWLRSRSNALRINVRNPNNWS